MYETILRTDTDLFLWLNSFHNGFWDIFMNLSSGRWIWLGLYFAIVISLWKEYGWKSMIIISLMCGLMVFLADQFTASFLRPYFGRLRPSHEESPISHLVHLVEGYRGGSYGFPSCHAANTFAVATLLTLCFRRLYFGIGIFFWAIINCYSRAYLGLHYPGDLIVGMIIGACCGVLGYCCLSIPLIRQILNKEKNAWSRRYFVKGREIVFKASDIVIYVEIITFLIILLYAAIMS